MTYPRRRGLTVALAAMALLAGGGAAIATAQPDPSSEASGAAPTTAPGPSSSPADRAAPSPAIRLGGGALHGEYVVPDGDGGYRTQLMQVGEIESVDDERLTVLSEDGYSRFYSRTADTVVGGAGWSVTQNEDGSVTVRKDDGELSTGQIVRVIGTVDGDTATAVRIMPRPTGDAKLPDLLRERLDGMLRGPDSRKFEFHAPRDRVERAPAAPGATRQAG